MYWILDETKELLLIFLSVITALWLSKKIPIVILVFLFLCMFKDSPNLKSTLSERIQEDKLT